MSKNNNHNYIIHLLYLTVAIAVITALFIYKIQQNNSQQKYQQDLQFTQDVVGKAISGTVTIQARAFINDTLAAAPSGSGFIIDNNGTILTNEHVITGCDFIYVVDNSGQKNRAELIASDKRLDIALLKVSGLLRASQIEIGDTTRIAPGDTVIASGNPLNSAADGEAVITMGRISKVNEKFSTSPDFNNDRFYDNLIQFDASICQGSSGGPLIDKNGRAIGIIVALSKDQFNNQSGYAIALDKRVTAAISAMLEGARVKHGFLGTVLADEIPHDIINKYNMNNLSGAYVNMVLPGSPAVNANIFKGDIIVKINGSRINDRTDLIGMVDRIEPGSNIEIEYLRPQANKLYRKRTTAEVELRTLANRDGYFQEGSLESVTGWGIVVKPVTEWRRRKAFLPNHIDGLLVYEVDQESLAFKEGIKPGDIITKVDKDNVATLSDFSRAISDNVFPPKFSIWKNDFIPARND